MKSIPTMLLISMNNNKVVSTVRSFSNIIKANSPTDPLLLSSKSFRVISWQKVKTSSNSNITLDSNNFKRSSIIKWTRMLMKRMLLTSRIVTCNVKSLQISGLTKANLLPGLTLILHLPQEVLTQRSAQASHQREPPPFLAFTKMITTMTRKSWKVVSSRKMWLLNSNSSSTWRCRAPCCKHAHHLIKVPWTT